MSRDGLTIAFDDVDRLSTAVQAHTTFVRACIGRVGRIATDPDFVASLPLAPVTGAHAGSALAVVMAGLTVDVAAADNIAVISATVVSTYRLAEESLALATSDLGAIGSSVGESIAHGVEAVGAGVVTFGSAGVLLGTAIVGLRIAVDSYIAGFADEFVDSLGPGLQKTLDEYADHPGLLIGGGALFGSLFGSNVGKEFSMGDVFARAILRAESSLGRVGPFYDDILRGLIACGNNLGFFIDTEARLGPSGLTEEELAEAFAQSRRDIWQSVMGATGDFASTADNRIVPTDLASLFASGQQIDVIGQDQLAIIRVITARDEMGNITGYTVQIPSTQSWDAAASAVPNDVTGDLHAMVRGRQTALAAAVLEAMRNAGIRPGDGPPIMMTGFSLGGITAAAIAADCREYNIRQVVTAGAPIGNFDISGDVRVIAFEADEDIVPRSDGASNPNEWTTVCGGAPHIRTDPPGMQIAPWNAHDLNRYAVMAQANPDVNSDPSLAKFLGGNLTVTDQFAVRQ
jgi:hypothetical protein